MNLIPFGDRVEMRGRRALDTPDVLLPSVELGVGSLDRITQGEKRIERAGADGRAHGVRQLRRSLTRDCLSESFADQLSRHRVTVAQQSDELVAAPSSHDV